MLQFILWCYSQITQQTEGPLHHLLGTLMDASCNLSPSLWTVLRSLTRAAWSPYLYEHNVRFITKYKAWLIFSHSHWVNFKTDHSQEQNNSWNSGGRNSYKNTSPTWTQLYWWKAIKIPILEMAYTEEQMLW